MKKHTSFLLSVATGIIVLLLLASCGHRHNFGPWIQEKEATCSDIGLEIRSCECGERESRPIPQKAHSQGPWVTDVEASCTASGVKYQICTECAAPIKTETTAPTGHVVGAWITVKEPECVIDGLKQQVCTNCQLTINVAHISATGHVEGEWTADPEPTCSAEGVLRQRCVVCAMTLKTQIIPKKPCYTVVLDAGHGGSDVGAGVDGVVEKYINLQVALKLKALLEAEGVVVVLTRSGDEFVSLSERAELANVQNADLFISVHCNFYDVNSSVRGFEVYYYRDSLAKRFADTILRDLSNTGKVKIRNVKSEDYHVLMNTNMPAILLEMGFLTNEQDRNDLCEESYQNLLAKTIASSVLKTLKESHPNHP